MRLEVLLSVAIGLWIAVILVVLSLCRAAKQGDEAMDAALAGTSDTEITRLPAPERSLRTLSLDEAASLLDVSPNTLLAWDERYGFPTSSASASQYSEFEVLALRDSLNDGLSIASAVIRARDRIKRRRSPGLVEHRDGGLAS
jgi:hypothetical protein